MGDIGAAFGAASARADVVTVTGGLGPTVDDITAAAAAQYLGVDMVRDATVDAWVRDFHAKFGIPCPDNALEQALAPRGAHIIHNPAGTAPCICFESGRARFAMFPGVPREMREMLGPALEWQLNGRAAGTSVTRTLHLFGIGESTLQPMLPVDIITSENPSFSFLPVDYQIHLRLTARADTREQCLAMLEASCKRIYECAGAYIFGEDGATLEGAVFDKLLKNNLTLAIAESVTGGMAAARFVNVPGASRVFLGGVVAYSEKAKIELLGVSPETLAKHGPVSEAAAIEMARGVRERLDASLGLATTGNAGQDTQAGPVAGHGFAPVGHVFAALAFRDPARAPIVISRQGIRSRNDLRAIAALFALDMIRKHVP
jgi:nicotinamide-nucleotide amidase